VTRYINLAEYLWLAEQVTGIEAAVLAKVSRADLADSALHAPAAGFGEEDFYPDTHAAVWPGITRCPMATSGPHGRRWCCSSI
jgi:death-on-curing protein